MFSQSVARKFAIVLSSLVISAGASAHATAASNEPAAGPVPTPLFIVVPSMSRAYGDPNEPFDCRIGSPLNPGDVVTVSCSTTADELSPVGTYSIVPTLAGPQAGNYDPIGVGALIVTPAPLTIVADDAARVVGAPNPAFTGTISGLRNREALSAMFATSATQSSTTGQYAIVPSVTGSAAVLNNYSVNTVNGTLTIVPTDVVPQTGWWWNPSQPGTGFVIERRGNNMMMVGFAYNNEGAPIWASSSAPVQSSLYLGKVHVFHNGQTLTGAYQPPVDNGLQLKMQLQFADAANATLNWFGQTQTLQRFGFTGGDATLGVIQNGFWWNPAEGGRGFAIEVQGTTLFMAGYMFDSTGAATWYLTTGAMTSPTQYTGVWQQYGGGPALTGCVRNLFGGTCLPSVTNANAGAVSVTFTDATDGILTLPDGRKIPIVKLTF